MGHFSIQVTVDLYGHLIPGGNRQAVDRLDQLVDKTRFLGESAPEAHPRIVKEAPREVPDGNTSTLHARL